MAQLSLSQPCTDVFQVLTINDYMSIITKNDCPYTAYFGFDLISEGKQFIKWCLENINKTYQITKNEGCNQGAIVLRPAKRVNSNYEVKLWVTNLPKNTLELLKIQAQQRLVDVSEPYYHLQADDNEWF
jgi:hypothetical protein